MKIRTFLFVATSLLALSGFCDNAEVVKVRGKGIGTDRIEALKDAYRDAVEQAVGLYVDAEQMVANEDLVKDQILTHSNAYIEKYKIAKEGKAENGLISITILADIRKRALTLKIRDAIPSEMIDLSEISKNLHAQIVTDFKANDDALQIVKNELKGFQPLKQLMKVSLVSKQPVVEAVKDDSSLVRLWYPIKVEIDTQKYYQDFAPRWFRILDQIKTAPAKRVDLRENLPSVKAYDKQITEWYGTTRKKRTGILTRCDKPRDTKWPHFDSSDVLYRMGLALNEEFSGMAFLSARISGKEYILNGCCAVCNHDAYTFNQVDLYDSDKPEYKLVLRTFLKGRHSYGLAEQIPGDCDFSVALLMAANRQGLTGNVYKIPLDCIAEIVKWQHITACGTAEGYDYRKSAPEIDYTLRFLDVNSKEVIGQSFSLRNLELMNFGCVLLEDTKYQDHTYVGGRRLWLISPLVGGVAKSYVKWINIDMPKDDVAKIVKASISVEE